MKTSIAFLLAVTLAIAADVGKTGTEITIHGSSTEGSPKNQATKIKFEGPTMINNLDAGAIIVTGYKDGNIQKIKISDGKAEVLATYSEGYAPDAVYDSAFDAKGNKYVVCFAHNGADNDICTIKYDPKGEIEWVKIFNSGGVDISWSIGVDKNDDVYVAGFAYRADNSSDVRVIKYNPEGDIVWDKVYDSGVDDKPGAISFDKQGNVCVRCLSGDNDQWRAHIITYDKDGNLI